MGLQVQTLVRYPSYLGEFPILQEHLAIPTSVKLLFFRVPYKFFRLGQVFGWNAAILTSCPSILHKASSKSQEGMQMLKFWRLGPWQRRSVLHLKSHVGSVPATGVEHFETTTSHLKSCNRVGVTKTTKTTKWNHFCGEDMLAWSFKSWYVTTNVLYMILSSPANHRNFVGLYQMTGINIPIYPFLSSSSSPWRQATLEAKSLVTFCRSNLTKFLHKHGGILQGKLRVDW